jgi:enoyl-[acyl-carrier protein] reductase III
MTTGLSIDLHGKRALVTGGSRGIGRAIAIRLAEAGADVAINYLRNKGPAQETADAVRATGRQALLVKGNVADPETHADIFAAIREGFGSLDILVSNAASGVIKPALELTPKHWDWTMAINAAALPSRSRPWHSWAKGSHVIRRLDTGRGAGDPELRGGGRASKAALESLVRHLAVGWPRAACA